MRTGVGGELLLTCFLRVKHEDPILCRINKVLKVNIPPVTAERRFRSGNCSLLSSDVWEMVCFD